jgi:hypothetical protein
MRQAGFPTLRRRFLARALLAGGIAFSGAGCCQQPYWCYYPANPCAPAPLPSSVQAGPVCDVPTEVVEGGTKVVGGSSRSTTVSGGQAAAPRVVVSQPTNTSSRFSWRRTDDSTVATSVTGTTDDASVNRR